jgi:hypothetical protein
MIVTVLEIHVRRLGRVHQRPYGDGPDYTDRVLELVTVILSGAGRVSSRN